MLDDDDDDDEEGFSPEFIAEIRAYAIVALGQVFQIHDMEKREAEDIAAVWVDSADAAVRNMRKILDR